MAHLDQFDISDAKKKYISEEVNPVLENMVRQTLTAMPDDPLPFMIKFLKSVTGSEEYNIEEIEKENTALEDEIKTMKLKLEEAASKTATALNEQDTKEEDEEEEEEDDDIPEPPERVAPAGGRQSVSAEAYGAWNQKKAFTPTVHPKTDEQKERITKVLSGSFMFQALEPAELEIVIGAVKEVVVEPGNRIIKQGDNGDFMFICESGALECYVSKDGEEKMVKDVSQGDSFGELALLYNCARAASVQAKEKSICWQLDRDTFNHIVKDAAAKKRERYTEFFNQVPLLKSVDVYGRSQVADALQLEKLSAGDKIITQGEVGEKFYIIESGECKAVKTTEGAADMELVLKEGDYFGELALLNNEPRAASVSAVTDVKLLTLNRKAFNRLLGPLKTMLLGEANRYK